MDNSWMPSKNKSSAVDFVMDSIREALLKRQLNPGDKLPSENELAASMQVSRSTVREAMKVLSAYGIIDVVRGNGTYIREDDKNISMDSMLFGFLLSQPSQQEQLEFRSYIERIVVELAIKNATQEDIDALEQNNAELGSIEDNTEKSSQVDIHFHELLGKATHNRLIARTYMFAIAYFHASIESTHKNAGTTGALRVHKMLTNAIRTRDYSKAGSVILENVNTWFLSSDKMFFG